jgi:hypothetical protein
MPLRNRTRLHKLCSRAVAETDPQKLAVLLIEIDDILCQAVVEVRTMLKDVEQLVRGRNQLSRIHLV